MEGERRGGGDGEKKDRNEVCGSKVREGWRGGSFTP